MLDTPTAAPVACHRLDGDPRQPNWRGPRKACCACNVAAKGGRDLAPVLQDLSSAEMVRHRFSQGQCHPRLIPARPSSPRALLLVALTVSRRFGLPHGHAALAGRLSAKPASEVRHQGRPSCTRDGFRSVKKFHCLRHRAAPCCSCRSGLRIVKRPTTAVCRTRGGGRSRKPCFPTGTCAVQVPASSTLRSPPDAAQAAFKTTAARLAKEAGCMATLAVQEQRQDLRTRRPAPPAACF